MARRPAQTSGETVKSSDDVREGHSEGAGPSKDRRIENAWVELEEKLARIPLDRNRSTVRYEDEPYIAGVLLATGDPGFDYELWRYMDRDEIPRWTQRHRWRVEWELWTSLEKLFARWYKESVHLGPTYSCSKLPLMLRFALKRPLMPEPELEAILRHMDLDPTFSKAFDIYTKRATRARQLLMGMDPDLHEASHVSGGYKELMREDFSTIQRMARLPTRGKAIETPNPYTDQLRRSEDDTETERPIRAACSVWGSFRAGEIGFSSALDQFRAILEKPNISDYDLAWRLEAFDIPIAHMLGEDNQLHPWPEVAAPDEYENEILQEIVQHVESCRSGVLTLEEALLFICEGLAGMDVDHEVFSCLISSRELSAYEVAVQIWEWSAMRPDPDSLEVEADIDALSIEGFSIEEIAQDFVGKYKAKIVEGLDPGLALTEYREEIGVGDFSPSQVSYLLARVPSEQTSSDDTHDVRDEVMSPPAKPTTRNQSKNVEGREPNVGPDPCGTAASLDEWKTSSSNLAKTDWRKAFSGSVGNPKDWDFEDLSSSSDEGVSDSLFGLVLPTKEARKIGQRIGLPPDFIRSRIRSSTSDRVKLRKRRKLSVSITSPKKRRKVSSTEPKGRHVRSKMEQKHSSPFAEDGEDQETFVRNNFSEGSLLSQAGIKLRLKRDTGSTGSMRAESHPDTNSTSERSATLAESLTKASNSEVEHNGEDVKIDEAHSSSSDREYNRIWQTYANRIRSKGFNPETVISLLRIRILDHGALTSGHVRDKEATSSAASTLLQDLSDFVEVGAVKQPRSNKDREAISLLTKVAMNPTGFSVAALMASVTGDEDDAAAISLDINTLQEGSPAHRLLTYFEDSPLNRSTPSSGHSFSPSSWSTQPSSDLTTPSSTSLSSPHLDPKQLVLDESILPLPISLQQDESDFSKLSLGLPEPNQSLQSTTVSLWKAQGLDPSIGPPDPFKCAYGPQPDKDDAAAEPLASPAWSPSAGGIGHAPKEEARGEPNSSALGLTHPEYARSTKQRTSIAIDQPSESQPISSRQSPTELDGGRQVDQGSKGNHGEAVAATVSKPKRPRRRKHSKKARGPPSGFFHGTTQDTVQWAFRKRTSIFVLLEMLRLKRKNANARMNDDRFFQNSSSNSGSSGSTSALNKLFDKYRGMLSSSLHSAVGNGH